MASPSPSFLLQLVRYVSSLPTHFMRVSTRALPLLMEGSGGAIRPLAAAPKPKPPGPPAEGPGDKGGIIHAASPLPRGLMRAAPQRQGAGGMIKAPQRPGAPAEGTGGRGGIIHAASS
ncbi:translation initiation factor IF-2-like [Lolium rigidum]|uniref:translation initiation factor IF-2-like n=1 Tax=Lolium rigidum TaxID=89674 RepID=UPI001F5C4F41|nr:translation initiation factor IF-2-like [Lolium rigidum]